MSFELSAHNTVMNYPITTFFVLLVVIALIIVMATGCSTTATFEKGEVTVDSRNVVAEQVVEPDGAIKTKIDTTQKTWWDTVKNATTGFFKAVGGFVNRGTVNVGN